MYSYSAYSTLHCQVAHWLSLTSQCRLPICLLPYPVHIPVSRLCKYSRAIQIQSISRQHGFFFCLTKPFILQGKTGTYMRLRKYMYKSVTEWPSRFQNSGNLVISLADIGSYCFSRSRSQACLLFVFLDYQSTEGTIPKAKSKIMLWIFIGSISTFTLRGAPL